MIQRIRSAIQNPHVKEPLNKGAPQVPVKSRIVSRNGHETVRRIGMKSRWNEDLYHQMLTVSWTRFMALSAAFYVVANLFFAFLYWVDSNSIANVGPNRFLDLFFFSVETFSTVGYGVMAPQTIYANCVMTLETLAGIMAVALLTGVLFARVSLPTAAVMFSKVAVIDIHNGKPALMVRFGNQRRSQIIDATVGMAVLRSETTAEGKFMRRLHDLRLQRERTPVVAISFTAVHVIDEDSPLFEVWENRLTEGNTELLITVVGYEETMGQTVHARASFLPEEILPRRRYCDIFGVGDDGRRVVDYRMFHETEPAA
jgi:inward rectifier potassium channel